MSANEFAQALQERGISFFTGVPDSLLSSFSAVLLKETTGREHVIAANEGNAIGLAAGHCLASGQPALVYMQNSGLGNAVNPLLSLTDREVYNLPLLLLIGWRGEPGTKDEPQHVKQGKVTIALLEAMGIAWSLLPKTMEETEKVLNSAFAHMAGRGEAYALVVQKDSFAEVPASSTIPEEKASLSREAAIAQLLSALAPEDALISTTGKTSRELFELREKLGMGHEKDFLTVGSMGHASSIALGLALSTPKRQGHILCLEGDGALLMHTGALATAGQQAPRNFRHIILNNASHDSVGGQPTAVTTVDIPALALAAGYRRAWRAEDEDGLVRILPEFIKEDGPSLLEIVVKKGARSDLGRPTRSPLENRDDFMAFIGSGI